MREEKEAEPRNAGWRFLSVASGAQGSRVSIFRRDSAGLAVPSHTGHRMLPRTTQSSHRPRVSDRTMVGTSPPRWLAGASIRQRKTQKRMDLGTHPRHCAQPRSRIEHRSSQQGLDVRELPLPASREKNVLLTSPFIEPGGQSQSRPSTKAEELASRVILRGVALRFVREKFGRPSGTCVFVPLFPALSRWAKLGRPFGADSGGFRFCPRRKERDWDGAPDDRRSFMGSLDESRPQVSQRRRDLGHPRDLGHAL